MMQLIGNSIVEAPQYPYSETGGSPVGSITTYNCHIPYEPSSCYTSWNSYPVYVCTDKTAKAIQILKQLQIDKQIECKSVPKFIELIEKIAGILGA